MPGKFIDEVHIYQCGQRPDGSAIMCSEVLFDTKVPFMLSAAEERTEVGWREKGKDDVHIPLDSLVETMKKLGITVSFDRDEMKRLKDSRTEATATGT